MRVVPRTNTKVPRCRIVRNVARQERGLFSTIQRHHSYFHILNSPSAREQDGMPPGSNRGML